MKKLLLLVAAFLASFLAFAAFPPIVKTEYSVNGQQWYSTQSAACSAHVTQISSGHPEYLSYTPGSVSNNQCQWSVTNSLGGFTSNNSVGFAVRQVLTCAAGLKLVGDVCEPTGECVMPLVKDASGKCSCPAGTKEETDQFGLKQCKPEGFCAEMAGKFVGSGVQLDYGQRSVDRLGRMVGSSTSGCHASSGCVIQGAIAGCWGSSTQGGSGCLINTPTYTGGKCSDTSDDPSECPPGSKPSQYAAGVCIPDENNCPAGSSPSKYASGVCIPDENPCPAGQAPSKYVSGVCLPEDDPNADGNGEEGKPTNCPPGRVASRYAVGVCVPADTTVGDGSGGGGSTTCKDGKCTTTNPDGSEEEKPEQEFCKENPDAPQCKKSNWGGSCGSFSCDGDAIQCAIAKEQHQRNCKLFDEKASHPAYQAAVDGTDEESADKLKGKAEQISVGTNFDQSGYGWAKACPADPEIALGFVSQSFTIPFSRICGPLEALSLAGVGITLLGCMVWVIGGKKA